MMHPPHSFWAAYILLFGLVASMLWAPDVALPTGVPITDASDSASIEDRPLVVLAAVIRVNPSASVVKDPRAPNLSFLAYPLAAFAASALARAHQASQAAPGASFVPLRC